jgi:hypothetical protein
LATNKQEHGKNCPCVTGKSLLTLKPSEKNTGCGIGNGTTSIQDPAFKTTTTNWIGRKKNICLRGHQVDTDKVYIEKLLGLLRSYQELAEKQEAQIEKLLQLCQSWRALSVKEPA